jgi:outer membrane protein assembly factor BamB
MQKRRQAFIGATAFGIAILVAFAHAQVGRGGSAWLTAHGDAQRTSWIRSDALISVGAMSKPGFELQWKTKLENENRRSYGLSSGVSAPGVTLFVPMSLVTGSSNNVYAIDSDTGYLVWQRHFEAPLPAATDACPGGTTSSPTRIVSLEPPPVFAGTQPGGGERNTQGYHTVLGQPGEGAPVDVRTGGPGRGGAPPAAGRGPGAPANAASPPAGRAPAGAPGQRAAGPAPGRGGGQGGGRGGGEPPVPGAPASQFGAGGLGRPSGVVYAIASDGVLHVMGLQSGKDLQKPAPFVPANARWSDPIAVGTMLYTSTSGGCGGAPDAVWAIDLESEAKPVVSWKSGQPLIGSIAFTTNGRLITVTSHSIGALDARTLRVGESLTVSDAEFITGPTIFRDRDREFVAAGLKGGGIYVANIPSGTPATKRSGAAVDALATWLDDTNARWIIVPTAHAVEALRVDKSGGWTASDLSAPTTPVVVNGVVFVLEHGPVAVLHAYDGATGKELWTSGTTMTAAAAAGSFWSAFGQVYVGTLDGTLYAFGFSDLRH